MTQLAQGVDVNVTFNVPSFVQITLDPNEAARVSVASSAGLSLYSSFMSHSQSIGPFPANAVMSLTAVSGTIDYFVSGVTSTLALTSRITVKNPKGLRRARSAIAAAQYSVSRINCGPDSITLGSYSNDTSAFPVDSVSAVNGYVGRLAAMLARQSGSRVGGFISATDSRVTISGTSAKTGSVGLSLGAVRVDGTQIIGTTQALAAGVGTLTFAIPPCATVELIWMESNTTTAAGGAIATGTFSYNLDAVGAVTTTAVSPSAPVNYQRLVLNVSDATATSHSLVLTPITGTVYIVGIKHYDATGFCVSRFGLGGATIQDMLSIGPATNLTPAGAVSQRLGGFMGPTQAAVIIANFVLTAGSPIATTASTAGMVKGMPIGASANLPSLVTSGVANYILSVDSATQITMSQPAATGSASQGCYVGAGVTETADVWIVPCVHNDYLQQNNALGASPAQFQAQLQTRIDSWVATGGCVLLVGEPYSNVAAPIPQTFTEEQYFAVLDQLALSNDHVASIQLNQAWGSFAQSSANGLNSVTSGVHPIKKGSADMAQIIYDVLMLHPTETV